MKLEQEKNEAVEYTEGEGKKLIESAKQETLVIEKKLQEYLKGGPYQKDERLKESDLETYKSLEIDVGGIACYAESNVGYKKWHTERIHEWLLSEVNFFISFDIF